MSVLGTFPVFHLIHCRRYMDGFSVAVNLPLVVARRARKADTFADLYEARGNWGWVRTHAKDT